MKLIVDASILIAVLVNEPTKARIIELTKGAELVAPASVHWEIGNAFSAMLKRKKIKIGEVLKAIHDYNTIPLTYTKVKLEEALIISDKLNLYAYDAYLIAQAIEKGCPLMTLDKGLIMAAKAFGVEIMEVIE